MVYLITGPDDEIDIVEAPDMQKAIDGWRMWWFVQDNDFDQDPQMVEEFAAANVIIVSEHHS